MFKRLQKNMLFFNLGLITTFILIVLVSLYVSTLTDINQRIQNELEQTLTSIESIDNPNLNPAPGGIGFGHRAAFTLKIQNGEVVDEFYEFNFDQTLLDQAFERATSTQGKITINDETWSYLSKEVGDITYIAFTNTSMEQSILNSQLTTYIIVLIGSVVIAGLLGTFITRHSIKPIKETFDKQKQFIADASHELKTPLTVINTNIDVLLSSNHSEADQKWLNYIKTEVNRMNKLTHNLLYLANLDNKENQYVKSIINVSEKTESTILSVEALAFEKGIKIDYIVEKNINVLFNNEQYSQAIMILLDNAIKYSEDNQDVEVSLSSQNNQVIFTIRNTGNEISPKELEHIFDRFYKTDKSRVNTSNSFGLGLSILKSICDENNTKISVTSENNVTEFILKMQKK